MKKFMDKDFLLTTETAKVLYHNYASKMPIIDYHCHIDPKEIAEDKRFDNITQIWLGGDHYKWRLMRANGVEEKYITGDASDKEKFLKYAETLPKAIGNPVFHFSHLELQRYFDYHKPLNKDTAEEVWEIANAKLQDPSMSARNIIKASNVTDICTTDDPIDTLEWHKKIAEDKTFDVNVYPTFRPDKAMNLEKADYLDYLSKLSVVCDTKIETFEDLKQALAKRIEHFNDHGCRVSDHGLEFIMYRPASSEEVEQIFKDRLNGQMPTKEDELKFKTAFMMFVAKEYTKHDWAMQLHYGAQRDNNKAMFEKLGPDTGFDAIYNYCSSLEMSQFFNALNITGDLPKTIIYSLNPLDDATIESVMACFQDSSVAGKLQHGSAWWVNDHKKGMMDQMTSLANYGLLANFVGMLTDSRSFLSYARHEYFRRLLCDLVGTWVDNGEYPGDMDGLKAIIEGISYNNAKNYFKF
jgi:glucuronate isomerase